MFFTGLFLSGLMIWWSWTLWKRNKTKKESLTTSELSHKNDFRRKSSSKRSLKEIYEETNHEIKQVATETKANLSRIAEPLVEQHAAGEDSSQISSSAQSIEPRGLHEESPESSEPQDPEEEPLEASRPTWKDREGRSLHVGAKVSFAANNDGAAVLIQGIFLGEKEDKALIEVGYGAPIPKNDYVIPWNLVTLAD